VDRLRLRFSMLLWSALSKQLVLKRVISQEEVDGIWDKIKFEFTHDNFFVELKDTEIQRERFNLLAQIDPYVGKYVSSTWVKKRILRQTDEEMEQMDHEMDADEANGFQSANPMQGGPDGPDMTGSATALNTIAKGTAQAMPGQGQPGGPDGPAAAQESGAAGQ
jgi:hypothetical protein